MSEAQRNQPSRLRSALRKAVASLHSTLPALDPFDASDRLLGARICPATDPGSDQLSLSFLPRLCGGCGRLPPVF